MSKEMQDIGYKIHLLEEAVKAQAQVIDQETTRRIAAEEALKFYADLENFGKVVWENDERDKRCWTEPFDSYEIIEIYAEYDTGDFGIKAEEHLAKYAEGGK